MVHSGKGYREHPELRTIFKEMFPQRNIADYDNFGISGSFDQYLFILIPVVIKSDCMSLVFQSSQTFVYRAFAHS